MKAPSLSSEAKKALPLLVSVNLLNKPLQIWIGGDHKSVDRYF